MHVVWLARPSHLNAWRLDEDGLQLGYIACKMRVIGAYIASYRLYIKSINNECDHGLFHFSHACTALIYQYN